ATAAFEGFVLFFEPLEDGGVARGEALESVFFVDGVGGAAHEDGLAGQSHAAGDDGDEAVPGVLDEAAGSARAAFGTALEPERRADLPFAGFHSGADAVERVSGAVAAVAVVEVADEHG